MVDGRDGGRISDQEKEGRKMSLTMRCGTNDEMHALPGCCKLLQVSASPLQACLLVLLPSATQLPPSPIHCCRIA